MTLDHLLFAITCCAQAHGERHQQQSKIQLLCKHMILSCTYLEFKIIIIITPAASFCINKLISILSVPSKLI